MVFLAIFGKNVEDAFGHLRYLAFYLGLFAAGSGGGTAFFAHVGGFLFGLGVARLLAGRRAREPVPALS
jgi:membrane associated rhomboid family serine protease